MIDGMDSDVALTDDENEPDDADSDTDFATINMEDLMQESRDDDSFIILSDSSDSAASANSSDSDWSDDDSIPLSEMQAAKRRRTWARNGEFHPQMIPYVENQDLHGNFSAIDYYSQYIDQSLL